jgi:hypothetical protein
MASAAKKSARIVTMTAVKGLQNGGNYKGKFYATLL